MCAVRAPRHCALGAFPARSGLPRASGADRLLVRDEEGCCAGLPTCLHLAPFATADMAADAAAGVGRRGAVTGGQGAGGQGAVRRRRTARRARAGACGSCQS
ncbi:hypothetical protein K353_00005 [Kitasatospora sp. SolWspMP-SS2h]|nr:hypothetical protein K353_00005 [Kitasatospora sp. SolWspMP-SS2h]